VAKAFGFLASRWVSLVGQFSLHHLCYVTASAQLLHTELLPVPETPQIKIISLTIVLSLIRRRELFASKRPRHHQRELFSPERAAVRSGPLFHDNVRTYIAQTRPPTSSHSQGKRLCVRQQGTCANSDSASPQVGL